MALAEGLPVPQDLLGVLLTAADEAGQKMTDEELWEDVHDVMGAGGWVCGRTMHSAQSETVVPSHHWFQAERACMQFTQVLAASHACSDSLPGSAVTTLALCLTAPCSCVCM